MKGVRQGLHPLHERSRWFVPLTYLALKLTMLVTFMFVSAHVSTLSVFYAVAVLGMFVLHFLFPPYYNRRANAVRLVIDLTLIFTMLCHAMLNADVDVLAVGVMEISVLALAIVIIVTILVKKKLL